MKISVKNDTPIYVSNGEDARRLLCDYNNNAKKALLLIKNYMKGTFFFGLLCLLLFAACRKKDSNSGLSPSGTNTPTVTLTKATDSVAPLPSLYFIGDFHVVTPMYDTLCKKTVFLMRYVSVDSFVIATQDYLPYRPFAYSGWLIDSIMYGFKRNNDGSYYRRFNNDYTVRLNFIKDSAYIHMWQMNSCPDYSTGDFAGKIQN